MISASRGLSSLWRTSTTLTSSYVTRAVTCKSLVSSSTFRHSSNIAEPNESSSSSDSTSRTNRSSMKRELIQRIKIAGPMSVAEYMKFVLTHPVFGFYMNQDVFGQKGHFTTSPEVSQTFGELVAIWLIHQWNMVGSPKPFRIIELGPGRGTLASDISRVLSQFSSTRDNSSLHLIEVSPHLTQIQEQTICGVTSLIERDRKKPHHSLTKMGIPISWYHSLEELPEKTGFNAFVAHEFFDALPVHKFQQNERGEWREIFVDFDDKEELRFVLSRNETPACKVLIRPELTAEQEHIEVCPTSGVIVDKVMDRVNAPNTNGCFLICDYGYDGVSKVRDTFRAFKNHQQWDPLKEPGTADLTADVDFDFIRRSVAEKALAFGPVSQKHFLLRMGIEIRLQKLLENTPNQADKDDLRSGVNMIVNEMGEKFKFLSLFPKGSRDFFHNNPPPGFL